MPHVITARPLVPESVMFRKLFCECVPIISRAFPHRTPEGAAGAARARACAGARPSRADIARDAHPGGAVAVPGRRAEVAGRRRAAARPVRHAGETARDDW